MENFPLIQFEYHAKSGCRLPHWVGVCWRSQKIRGGVLGAQPLWTGGVPDLGKTPFPQTCYHAEFGNSTSNGTGVRTEIKRYRCTYRDQTVQVYVQRSNGTGVRNQTVQVYVQRSARKTGPRASRLSESVKVTGTVTDWSTDSILLTTGQSHILSRNVAISVENLNFSNLRVLNAPADSVPYKL